MANCILKKRIWLIYQKALILTGLGNTDTSHIKRLTGTSGVPKLTGRQNFGLGSSLPSLAPLHLGLRAQHINSCRTKSIANSILPFMFIVFVLGCPNTQQENGTDTRETAISAIQPKPLFVPETKRINLYQPLFQQTLQSLGNNEAFFFDTKDAHHVAIYIFSIDPDFSALQSGDLNGCVGGASSLAGYAWNDLQITFGIDSNSQLYKCQTDNAVDVFSETEKLTYTDLDLNSGSTYYWFILGFDEDFLITHSSEVRTFRVP